MLHRYLAGLFLLFGDVAAALFRAQSLEFVRNDGQWDGDFAYRAITGTGDAYLSKNSFTYVVGARYNDARRDSLKHGLLKEGILRYHAYRVQFEGAADFPAITGSKEQSWYYNYFLGNDQSRWHSGIHPALAVDYKGLYPGVDMHVASHGASLEYEFIVAPDADPSAIRLRYEGTEGIAVKGKNLIIRTSVGEAQELKPVAFQYTADGRREVPCFYRLKGNVVTYNLPDGWDRSLPLIIDPVVIFATFTGSTTDNWGFTATYDAGGNFYAGGIAAGTGFPVSTGAFQTSFGGGTTSAGVPGDIALIKYNPTGTTKIWASYLGGSGLDQPHSLIVDSANELVLAGRTFSSNFPVTSGCYDPTYNGGADIIVTKINAAGTALVGSTYIGGSGDEGINIYSNETSFGSLKYNYGDDARSEVLLDAAANVYVTASSSSTDFPVTSNAFQSTNHGNQDAVFFKLSPGLTSLTYSTYLGGSGDDAGYVLALNRQQTAVYVGGGTASSNFPATTGAWKSSYQGGPADGYIARFNNSGTYAMQKLTFVGTANYDQVYGLQVDYENSVYAMGQSLGGAFPVTAGTYSNANSTQFVIKMDSLLATDIFSTVFGSGNSTVTNISPVAFLVDTCQNIYISGWGGNLGISTAPATTGTTVGMPVTASLIPAGSVLSATTDGYDFYFIALSRNAGALLFGAFYGRYSTTTPFYGEHVDGGTSRFDKSGVVYQAICGNCGGSTGPPLPTTAGSFCTTDGSSNCNLASLKIAFQLGAPDAVANGNPRARGCPPLTVNFQNLSTNSISYQWDFRDGSAIDTTFAPAHTFTTPGVYAVRLVVYNPNACKVRDTAYITINVDSNRVKPDFTFKTLDSCGPFRVMFSNTSVLNTLPGAAARTTYTWHFGDGTSYNGITPPIHSFPTASSFTVVLIMRDSLSCNYPDSIKKVVNLSASFVKAVFVSPDTVCLRSGLTFVNQSMNATGITWYFGDGQSSTNATSITHSYATFGTYNVMLVAANPASCNGRDTLKKTIRISRLPTADFTFVPVIPIPNTPIDFTNKSTNADYYQWTFGDGAGSSETNPSHLYRKSGSFNACLKALSNEGCADSICKGVESDVHTAIDVPTAFSPNGDGSNDILYVRGGAIVTMSFKLFNRWGEKVFETTTLDRGWDGTYNGKPAPIDAYAYVLTASFIDGSSVTKKGNITLLR